MARTVLFSAAAAVDTCFRTKETEKTEFAEDTFTREKRSVPVSASKRAVLTRPNEFCTGKLSVVAVALGRSPDIVMFDPASMANVGRKLIVIVANWPATELLSEIVGRTKSR